MAEWLDVRRHALALPETTEVEARGNLEWRVRGKLFVWERPLRATDLKALGARAAPDRPILGVRVLGLDDKEALLAEDSSVFFTIPHFDGHAGLLVHLDVISTERLGQLVTEAWLARAPRPLVRAFLGSTG